MTDFTSRLKRIRTTSPLSIRLLAWILLFSSAFTLLASGIQIYSDYRQDIHKIKQRLSVIEASYSSSLARSLWALDQKSLQTQMEGILSLPDIDHLRLRIEPGSELVMGQSPRGDFLSHSFDLVYRDDEPFNLGRITISAGLERVYQDLRHRVGVIIATQFFTIDRKSTRLNSSHVRISYAVFCLKKKKYIKKIIYI